LFSGSDFWFFRLTRLDLDAWINDPPSSSSDDEDYNIPDHTDIFIKTASQQQAAKVPEPTEEELQQVGYPR